MNRRVLIIQAAARPRARRFHFDQRATCIHFVIVTSQQTLKASRCGVSVAGVACAVPLQPTFGHRFSTETSAIWPASADLVVRSPLP